MTIQEIHSAMAQGKTVCWENTLYELRYVDAEADNKYAQFSYKDGKAIRVTCVSNYFGSLMTESCASKCFIKN